MPQLTIRKALNKAFLKAKPNRQQIELFKTNLIHLAENVNENQGEEYHKGLVVEFLKNTYYSPDYFINTKDRKDQVIHKGKSAKSPVAVIIEAKSPGNKAEMLSAERLNCKALQEILLYYLRERISDGNLEVKNLVVTNLHEWFIFDSQQFEKYFAQNKKLVKSFRDFEEGRLSGSKTDFFYKEIAAPSIAAVEEQLEYTWFDLRKFFKPLKNADKEDDKKLIPLYKVFSPEHLLKQAFANDSNSLNRSFYAELLHIIGLREEKDKGKKIIDRLPEGERQPASLLENTITKLEARDYLSRLDNRKQFGETYQEQLFNVALELVITWVNRVLFLKLLEAQLLSYHKGEQKYTFLTPELLENYDDLDALFFQVLANQVQNRKGKIADKFAHVPYLNSSLFEGTDIEFNTIFVGNLQDDLPLPLHGSTVLKDNNGKRLKGEKVTLNYLLSFLNAYDFSSEGGEEIQEENKSLINASVLGLIFEKINGYKDGSFFTPGFITMYMCRETLRRAVVQKFNEAHSSPAKGRWPEGPEGSGTAQDSNRPDFSSAKTTPPLEGGEFMNLPHLKTFRKELRKDLTPAEATLWKILKGKKLEGRKFRRQHSVGKYVLDFYCPKEKLAIELDGEGHFEADQHEKDKERDIFLKHFGINVIRIENKWIYENQEGVIQAIINEFGWHSSPVKGRWLEEPEGLNPAKGSWPAGPEGLNPARDSNRPDSSYAGTTPPLEGGERAREHHAYKDFNDLYEGIGRDFTREQANQIINSLKICDPAVGSGHFLVSALNELIAIKSELNILQDKNGKTLRDYDISIENDELIITDENGAFFEYHPHSKESQRVQETLFHEKQTLIENCLFGVDINPNSVKICRLRLWIELLKNAYYKKPSTGKEDAAHSSPAKGRWLEGSEGSNPAKGSWPGGSEGSNTTQETNHPDFSSAKTTPPLKGGELRELETLPNIDINIKCGNSLISRFALDEDLNKALKKSKYSIEAYQSAVHTYQHAESKEQKRQMEKLIADIKSDFRSEINANSKEVKQLYKTEGAITKMLTQQQMFEMGKREKATFNKDVKKLQAKAEKLRQTIEEIRNNAIYDNAFEWRFEFPEVLGDNGDFMGFDAIIGNPPYIRQEELKEIKPYLQEHYETYSGTADMYVFFVERGLSVMRNNGQFIYILPNKWMRAGYGDKLRQYLQKQNIESIIDLGDLPVFEEATTYPCIMRLQKTATKHRFESLEIKSLDFEESLAAHVKENAFEVDSRLLQPSGWTLNNVKVQKLLEKLRSKGKPLGEYVEGKIYRGVLTGLNEAFVIDQETRDTLIAEDPKSAEIIKPFLAGRDIKRYEQPESNKYVIFTRRGIDIVEYPAVLKHLKQYKEKLMPKPKNFKGSKWPGRKEGSYEWYEIQDNTAYYQEFEKEKILWPGITSDINPFAFDAEGNYGNDNNHLIVTSDKALLGILNSQVAKFFLSNVADFVRGGFIRLKISYVSTIPIPTDQQAHKEYISTLVEKRLEGNELVEAEIDRLVYGLYGLSEEEIGVVENLN